MVQIGRVIETQSMFANEEHLQAMGSGRVLQSVFVLLATPRMWHWTTHAHFGYFSGLREARWVRQLFRGPRSKPEVEPAGCSTVTSVVGQGSLVLLHTGFPLPGWHKKVSEAVGQRDSHETGEDVIKFAHDIGMEIAKGGFLDQRNYSETEVVEWLLREQDPQLKNAGYAILSEAAHGRPYASSLLLATKQDFTPGLTTAPAHLEGVLDGSIRMMLLALLDSFASLFDYVGINNDSDLPRWRIYVVTTLRAENTP